MNYLPWLTLYAANARLEPNIRKFKREVWVQQLLREKGQLCTEERRSVISRAILEEKWMAEGQPYYNIHPKLVDRLLDVANLDKIPSSLIEVPNNFCGVNIRLPELFPVFAVEKTGKVVDSMMLFNNDKPDGIFIVARMLKPGTTVAELHQTENASYMHLYVRRMHCSVGSILEGLVEDEHVASTVGTCKQLSINCVKLIIATGFLANGTSDMVTPDVLKQDEGRFIHSSEEEKERIVQRARRQGKVGWNVGNDLMFLGEGEYVPNKHHRENKEDMVTGTHRELRFRHLRKGHLHAVRHGPGKSKVKIMWFRTTVVREDLPFFKNT